MVGKYELLMGVVDALPEKGLLEKAATIDEIFIDRYSELRKQMGIKKDQYKFLIDQMNVSNNNGKDDVEPEDGEIDKVNYRYINDK